MCLSRFYELETDIKYLFCSSHRHEALIFDRLCSCCTSLVCAVAFIASIVKSWPQCMCCYHVPKLHGVTCTLQFCIF